MGVPLNQDQKRQQVEKIFKISEGLFKLMVLQFGFTNAPATF